MTAVTSAPGNLCQNLVSELRIDLQNLEPLLSQECCIYRVPSNLRRVNEAAYTPQYVSIGPLHYGDENLKQMEKHKLRYLERFLKRAEGRSMRLEDFVGYVKENEERVRRCYAETFDHLNGDKFARMILVDAAFIIEHIMRCSFLGWGPMDEIKDHQLSFDIPYLRSVIAEELVLLENQLPFFLLEGLCGMAFEDVPFSHISHHFFNLFNYHEKPMPEYFKHFTDLVRYYQLPEEKEEEEEEQTQTPIVHTHSSWFSDCSSNLTKVLQRALQALLGVGSYVLSLPSCQQPREDNKGNVLLYSATELEEAGVRFQVCQSKNSLDIKFTHERNLEMPRFTIEDRTEAFFRNIMALEQCHYLEKSHVCDYLTLMDYLINTDKDVNLLVQNKILVNLLGSNQEVAS